MLKIGRNNTDRRVQYHVLLHIKKVPPRTKVQIEIVVYDDGDKSVSFMDTPNKMREREKEKTPTNRRTAEEDIPAENTLTRSLIVDDVKNINSSQHFHWHWNVLKNNKKKKMGLLFDFRFNSNDFISIKAHKFAKEPKGMMNFWYGFQVWHNLNWKHTLNKRSNFDFFLRR